MCQLMDASELADDDLVAVCSNMGAPLVGQERLTDPKTMALAITMMEEYLGRKFRAVMSLEIGGGNSIQPFMARGHAGPPGGGRRLHGPRLPRSPDDQLRHPRPADVPAHPRRRARQRGGGGARGELEVDGAHQPQGLRGGGLHRLHLQGPAHGQGDQGVRDPGLDDQGHRDRPGGAGGAPGPPRSDRGGTGGGSRHQALQRQDPRHRPPHDGRLPARHGDHRGPRRLSVAMSSSSPSRTSSRWAGSTASLGS